MVESLYGGHFLMPPKDRITMLQKDMTQKYVTLETRCVIEQLDKKIWIVDYYPFGISSGTLQQNSIATFPLTN